MLLVNIPIVSEYIETVDYVTKDTHLEIENDKLIVSCNDLKATSHSIVQDKVLPLFVTSLPVISLMILLPKMME